MHGAAPPARPLPMVDTCIDVTCPCIHAPPCRPPRVHVPLHCMPIHGAGATTLTRRGAVRPSMSCSRGAFLLQLQVRARRTPPLPPPTRMSGPTLRTNVRPRNVCSDRTPAAISGRRAASAACSPPGFGEFDVLARQPRAEAAIPPPMRARTAPVPCTLQPYPGEHSSCACL